jgi:drug/metabolite transporter (DMT)-like permease
MGKLKGILVYVGIVMAMIFWSLSFIWYKDVFKFLSPFTTILFRLTISGAILFLVSFIAGRLQPVKKKDLRLFLLLALSEPFFYFIGESLGMQYVTPTIAAVMIALIPLFVPVFAFFVLKEQIIRKNIVGIFISFAGVLLVILNDELRLVASLKGVMLMSVAVASAVAYSIFLRKLASNYNPLTLIAWQNSIGAVLFLPLVLIFEAPQLKTIDFTGGMWVPLLNLSIFASSIAFLLYTYGVQNLGAFRANIFTNAIPVFTAIFSFYMMHERLLSQNILGIVLVVGGLVLSQLKPIKGLRKKKVVEKEHEISNS